MKTWQKNKGRNNWNRKRKQLIKEAVPIQPIDKPFIITKEYPNVVTLGAEGYFSTYYGLPEDYMEDQLMRRLIDSIKPFVHFELIHDNLDMILDRVKARAVVKVLDGRVVRSIDIYE